MLKLDTNSGFPELFLKYMTVSCDVTEMICSIIVVFYQTMNQIDRKENM
jgi:hypothetical protein